MEARLDGNVALCRFIFDRDKISKSDSRPMPAAFLPRYFEKLGRFETSVCRTAGCSDERLWQVATQIEPTRQVKGRAHLTVAVGDEAGLRTFAAEEDGYPEHAVMVDWPTHPDPDQQKQAHKAIAVAMAKVCAPVIKPTPT